MKIFISLLLLSNLAFAGSLSAKATATSVVTGGSSPKMAQVSLSPSNIGVANNTTVLVPFDTVVNDPDSLFQVGSNSFRVPLATVGTAKGLIGASVAFGTNLGGESTTEHHMYVRIFKDSGGGPVLYKDLIQLSTIRPNPSAPFAAGSTGWEGVAGDLFTVKVYQYRITSGASLDIGNNPQFTNAWFVLY